MNLADFLHTNTYSGKLKVTLGMHIVKYGSEGTGTLKPALSQE